MPGWLSGGLVLFWIQHQQEDTCMVTLPHSPLHASLVGAAHVGKTTSAQPHIAIVATWVFYHSGCWE